MKKLLLLLLSIAFFASCQKDYSLEYFNQYNADAPNVLMSKADGYKENNYINIEKYSKDLFIITMSFKTIENSNKIIIGQFNHNGKLLHYFTK